MHDRDRLARDERDRQAVGGEHDRRDAVERGRLPVGLVERRGGVGQLAHAAHVRAVDLQALQRALARDAGQRGEPVAVGVDGGAGRRRSGPEVQRVERRRGDAAAARREQHAAARQRAADVLADPVNGAGSVDADRRPGASGHRGHRLL